MQITTDLLFEYLADELFVDTSVIKPETLLFSSGLIDSFNMINLITFIEETGQIKIKPAEITLDNLDSIDRILVFLEKRAA